MSEGVDKINARILKTLDIYCSPINTYIKSFDGKIGGAEGPQKCGGKSNI